jgi:hypothetical protein
VSLSNGISSFIINQKSDSFIRMSLNRIEIESGSLFFIKIGLSFEIKVQWNDTIDCKK